MTQPIPELDEVDARFAAMRRRRRGLGLRWQILITLTLILVATVVLIGLVVLKLSHHDLERVTLEANVASSELLAQAIAAAVDPALPMTSPESRMRITELASFAFGESVSRVAVVDADGGTVADLHRGAELPELARHLAAPFDTGPTAVPFGSGADRSLAVISPIKAPNGRVRGVVAVVYNFQTLDSRTAHSQHLLIFYLLVDALVLLGAGYLMLTRFIVRPLRSLASGIEAVALGDYGRFVEVKSSNEMGQLAAEFNLMVGEIQKQRRALEGQVRQLEEAYARLEATQNSLIRSEKLASVGSLAAGIAHEVGNPLSAVIGYTDLLADGDLDPEETHDLITRIERETRRIDSTIRDLLDYSRAEGIEVEAGDLGETVGHTVALIRAQPRMRDIELTVELADALPLAIFNAGQLQQVLINLLTNAADAMEDVGRIEVRAEADAAEGWVMLTVSDDGPGITPDDLGSIFEPFFTTKTSGKGTGLGLAICQSLVDSFGGQLAVGESAWGGASFTIRLRASEPRAVT